VVGDCSRVGVFVVRPTVVEVEAAGLGRLRGVGTVIIAEAAPLTATTTTTAAIVVARVTAIGHAVFVATTAVVFVVVVVVVVTPVQHQQSYSPLPFPIQHARQQSTASVPLGFGPELSAQPQCACRPIVCHSGRLEQQFTCATSRE